MEDTYNLKAIVLNRKPYSECDSRVVVYSLESGKLDLVARGVKKIKSKSAGHLEPLNIADIMVVRGRKHDYIGAAVSQCCFGNIKNDLAKLTAVGRAVKTVDQLIKPGVADGEIFYLLNNYLGALEKMALVIPAKAPCLLFQRRGQHRGAIQKTFSGNPPAVCAGDDRPEIMTKFFIFKLLAGLGHKPELSFCVSCVNKIQPGKNRFDLAKGGLICAKCAKLGDNHQLAISDDAIKLLRLALKADFKQLEKVKIGKKLGEEVEGIIEKFFKYSF